MRAWATLLLTTTLAAQSSPAFLAEEAPRREPGLEEAAARGLAWLAQHQLPAGCWTAHVGHKQEYNYMLLPQALSIGEQASTGHGHVGVTSLAGLAFLAGGHLPDRGDYGEVVRSTLDYVLRQTEEQGFVTDSATRMYSHAFATLFLAQIYGMTGESEVRRKLERAVHWIVDCQNAQGAWRYNPFSREADLSVTVCQLQALRAARNIGIRVPRTTIDRAVDYVKRSRTDSGPYRGLYYYKIKFRGAYRKNTQFAVNAAAVTSLFSAGVHDESLVNPALGFLETEYDELARYFSTHFFFWYGNYYAAQAFFQAGGDDFDRYFARISRDLLEAQAADGRWINDVGPGDAFSTAVACMILQIPKQYLPIFQR